MFVKILIKLKFLVYSTQENVRKNKKNFTLNKYIFSLIKYEKICNFTILRL